MWKMRHTNGRTWKMARNTEKGKNEKCTLQDLEYGDETDQQGKCQTQIVGPGLW
jgi:hypothetical protein